MKFINIDVGRDDVGDQREFRMPRAVDEAVDAEGEGADQIVEFIALVILHSRRYNAGILCEDAHGLLREKHPRQKEEQGEEEAEQRPVAQALDGALFLPGADVLRHHGGNGGVEGVGGDRRKQEDFV